MSNRHQTLDNDVHCNDSTIFNFIFSNNGFLKVYDQSIQLREWLIKMDLYDFFCLYMEYI